MGVGEQPASVRANGRVDCLECLTRLGCKLLWRHAGADQSRIGSWFHDLWRDGGRARQSRRGPDSLPVRRIWGNGSKSLLRNLYLVELTGLRAGGKQMAESNYVVLDERFKQVYVGSASLERLVHGQPLGRRTGLFFGGAVSGLERYSERSDAPLGRDNSAKPAFFGIPLGIPMVTPSIVRVDSCPANMVGVGSAAPNMTVRSSRSPIHGRGNGSIARTMSW